MGFGSFLRGLRKTAIIIGRAVDNPLIKTVVTIWVPPGVVNLGTALARKLDVDSNKTNGQKHQELKEQLLPIVADYGLGSTEVDQLIKGIVAKMRGKGEIIPMLDDVPAAVK